MGELHFNYSNDIVYFDIHRGLRFDTFEYFNIDIFFKLNFKEEVISGERIRNLAISDVLFSFIVARPATLDSLVWKSLDKLALVSESTKWDRHEPVVLRDVRDSCVLSRERK